MASQIPTALLGPQSVTSMHFTENDLKFVKCLVSFYYTVVKVDGATPKRWRFVKGHGKPIHGSCAIYFLGGIFL